MGYNPEEKKEFAERLKGKTKSFSIGVIKLCESYQRNPTTEIITRQLVKAATSVASNYRAVCRARSDAEFHSKLSVVVEEADESQFWLEVIRESGIKCDQNLLNHLQQEIGEILKINATSRKTVSDSRKKAK
jgi:four helix bundle protein